VSNLDAFGDGLRVLTTILVERRRASRRHRSRRRRASRARTAVALTRGLIEAETAFARMLYVLHSIEHGPYMHRGRPRLSGYGRRSNLLERPSRAS
jgi:hypothetical protein